MPYTTASLTALRTASREYVDRAYEILAPSHDSAADDALWDDYHAIETAARDALAAVFARAAEQGIYPEPVRFLAHTNGDER